MNIGKMLEYNNDDCGHKIRSTTILTVRKDNKVVICSDGQVSLGHTVMKSTARKVVRLSDGKIICGFAGSVTDGIALVERLEAKLNQYSGQLLRAATELAKEWRSDRYLRKLEAMMIVVDQFNTLILAGNGDVIEPESGIAAIGSGGNYALSAAKALIDFDFLSAEEITKKAMTIASDICVYTNNFFSVEVIECDTKQIKRLDSIFDIIAIIVTKIKQISSYHLLEMLTDKTLREVVGNITITELNSILTRLISKRIIAKSGTTEGIYQSLIKDEDGLIANNIDCKKYLKTLNKIYSTKIWKSADSLSKDSDIEIKNNEHKSNPQSKDIKVNELCEKLLKMVKDGQEISKETIKKQLKIGHNYATAVINELEKNKLLETSKTNKKLKIIKKKNK